MSVRPLPCALAALLFASSAVGGERPVSLTVWLKGPAGPVPDAQVTVMDGETVVERGRSDDTGAVAFPDIGRGPRTLTVVAEPCGVTSTHRVPRFIDDLVLTIDPCAAVLTRELLQRVPSGRSYQTATSMAAGVVVGPSHAGNPNMAGAGAPAWNPTPPRIDPRAATEGTTDHGVGGTVLVARDPHSTFAIDVDTASFALARSSLDAWALPDPASVRVEEFVNAQRYDDPAPDGDAPFAASMEIAPSPTSSMHHVLRIGVRARDLELDRPPMNLTFLVDTSGSMQGPDRLGLAQESLVMLVNRLRPDDRVALVTYAGSTGITLHPTRIGDGEARIHQAIRELTSGGGTAMGSGMELAYDLAASFDGRGENRVIVLSDGDANIGASSWEDILASLSEHAGRGITMSTIGFGRGNYQDTLMEQLADHGDGASHYVDSRAQAHRLFGGELVDSLVTVARDVKIQVEFDPRSVHSYRLLGYENRDIADEDFRVDAVDAGEMGAGHTVTALYELVLRDDPGDRLAVLRMRSKPPGRDARAVERVVPLPTGATRETFASASPDFRIAWSAAAFAELLRRSPMAEELTWDEVAAVAREARRNTDDDELIALIERAGRIAGHRPVWPRVTGR